MSETSMQDADSAHVDVVETISEQVSPDDEEWDMMEKSASELQSRIQTELEKKDISAEITQTGSTARGTWVSGDRDIDIFIQFPTGFSTEQLEEAGMDIGQTVLPESRREFASHPYVKGTFNGFDVDIVPCYNIDDTSNMQSAVDRTPFHTEYLRDVITPELAADVRVAKKFLKGIGVYGSDVATGGFSGLLTELLVIEHNGFLPLLDAARTWTPPVIFSDSDTSSFSDPLVLIDPTDSERNVAAPLTEEKLAVFQHKARRFMASPDTSFFQNDPVSPITISEIRSKVENRKTDFVIVRFDRPSGLVEDTLVPQLRRTEQGLVTAVSEAGFTVIDSASLVSESYLGVLLELKSKYIPRLKVQEGPPVSMQEAAENFWEAHEDNEEIHGPVIQDDQLVIRRPRDFTNVIDYLQDSCVKNEAQIGASIEDVFSDRFVSDFTTHMHSAQEFFGADLRRFFEPNI